MALINIRNDAFNICERIKHLDPCYYVVFNTKNKKYEIHNSKQHSNTFCITCDNGLNFSVINKLRKTKIENIDKIIKEIDEFNAKNEVETQARTMDTVSVKAREMYDYAKTKVEDCNFSDSYTTKWV